MGVSARPMVLRSKQETNKSDHHADALLILSQSDGVLNDDSSGDVSCPLCGSCFNLAKDIETDQDDDSHAKMLGHFQLLNCLAQAAYGAAWQACGTKLDRIVAPTATAPDRADDHGTCLEIVEPQPLPRS
ncbi:MAG: hypothetical protein FJ302_13840 [Planctomycetes bacterium]|nr:hypothetical protein [Planctomycetota bacterium]